MNVNTYEGMVMWKLNCSSLKLLQIFLELSLTTFPKSLKMPICLAQ